MTRRIVLQLADDTTDKWCGTCRARIGASCTPFGLIVRHGNKYARHGACRSAELRPETVEAIRTELFAPQHAAELADFDRLFGGWGMTLTKERIETYRRNWVRGVSDPLDEICRLALLGLERDERASGITLDVTADDLRAVSYVVCAGDKPAAKRVYDAIVAARDACRRAPHAEHSDRVLAKLRAMTPEELRRTFIDAGIFDESGNLTEPYRG